VELHEAKSRFLTAKRARGLSQRTIVNYREAIDQLFGYLLAADVRTDLAGILSQDIEEFLGHLRDLGMSPGTCQNRFRTLRNFFRWCQREKILKTNPCKRLQAPIVKLEAVIPYTPAEVGGMLRAARRWPDLALRDVAIIALLLNTGMRAGELCTLKVEHVREGALLVTGKGKKERWLGLESTTQRLLMTYMATREEQRYVFNLSVGGLYRVVRRLAWAAEPPVPNTYTHRFRDTFAVRFLENGGQVNDLKTILGHASIETTMRYVAYDQERRATEAQRQFAPFAQAI